MVVLFSFNDSPLNAEWVGFTLRWYAKLAQDAEMLHAAANSLLIALAASSVATALGAMHRYRLRWLPLQVYSLIKVAVTPEVNTISTLLMALTLTVGLPQDRWVVIDALRRKRNAADYLGDGVEPDALAECRRQAAVLEQSVASWLAREHSALLAADNPP